MLFLFFNIQTHGKSFLKNSNTAKTKHIMNSITIMTLVGTLNNVNATLKLDIFIAGIG